jgi:heptosyltransferase-2
LRRRFPDAEIVAGVGDWNVDTLRGNPHLTDVMPVNAPWHNRITGTRNPVTAIGYIRHSPQVAALSQRHFEVGIDVLGSPFGSLLLMQAGIPWRIGVRGYAGGDGGVQAVTDYDSREHVGRAALRLAELLGATDMPPLRPQVFLSAAETREAEQQWRARGVSASRRVVIAPGGSHAGRAWPLTHFVELSRQLAADPTASIAVVGGPTDVSAAGRIAAAGGAADWTGRVSLRQTMAIISRADVVFCNSSVAMHAAAAFDVPAEVVLGEHYESARAHAAQWGHGDRSLILGRDDHRRDIFSPGEALHAARAFTVAALHA